MAIYSIKELQIENEISLGLKTQFTPTVVQPTKTQVKSNIIL